MDLPHLVSTYAKLPPAGRVEAMLRLAYELTLLGRDTYHPASPALAAPERLRALNEIQHRVISHARSVLAADTGRYPDEVLFAMILEQDDAELRRQVAGALARVFPIPVAA